MDTIENLEDQLRETTDHCHRATILNQLIWALGHRDLARSTTLLEDIAALIPQEKAHTRSDRTVIANYHVGKALLDSYCGRYGDAIVSAQTALIDLNADAPTDSNAQHLLRCKALEIMGICHVRLGSPSDALTNLRSALHIATEIDSQQAAATIHNGFAILYVNVGDHQNGANHFQKSLVCARAVGDRLGEARALVNLCMSYRDLGEYKQSLACGNEGLALTRELHAQRYEIGALGNLANTYLVLGESEKAFAYFQEAAQLSAQLENFPEQATTLLNMARAFLQQENHAQAKSYATLVLEIGQSHEQLGIQFESHEILAAIYKVEGDFATALQHFEAFHQIKERIFNTEAEEKLRQLEVAHRTETALRDAEIYQLRYVELQHEITERERAQKALVQAQKLDSLGILAGGVAHDFNNLLVSILGQIDLALYKLDRHHPARKNLSQANRSAEQAATLAQKMLAYSGRGLFQVNYCHIDEFLADNYAMWQKLLGAHCRLSMAIDPERSLVEMDTGQIAQLISNLLLNAEEADAQNVTLRTGCRTITTADVHFWQYTAEPLAEGRYVIITVADDGKGMDSHTREKLFDPFFTTKFTGRGLGMAASLGIVRGHRGGIAVRSQRNGGSTFEIAFPLVNSDRTK